MAERIGILPKGLDPKALYETLDRLQGSRDQLRLEMEKATSEMESSDEYVSLEGLHAFTEGLRKQLDQEDANPEIQAAIIRKLVVKIEVLAEGFEIFFHAGMNHYQAELGIAPGSAFLRFDDGNEKRPAFVPQRGGSRPHFIFSGKTMA